MEFDELKEKYTELRKRFLEVQRDEYRERADWNILFGKSRNLEVENEALKREIKALKEEHERQKDTLIKALKEEHERQKDTLKKEYEVLKDELRHNEELIKKEVYNDFNCIIKEKEEKFEIDFPPIEPIEE